MKEILAETLDLAILELKLIANKTYEDDRYQIWQMGDSEFGKICNVKEEDWKSEWGMWRSAKGSVLKNDIKRFTINNKYMYGFDGDFREDEIEDMKLESPEDRCYTPRKYYDLYDYLSNEIGCSTPRNIIAVCMDLSRINKIPVSELFSKYNKKDITDKKQ